MDYRSQLLAMSPRDLLLVVLAETESRANLARAGLNPHLTVLDRVVCHNTLAVSDEAPF